MTAAKANDFTEGLDQVAEYMKRVGEMAVEQRARLLAAGFDRTTAENLAQDVHTTMTKVLVASTQPSMASIFGGLKK